MHLLGEGVIQSTADLIEDKNVQVKKVAKDQYGRTIANVTVGGLDVNRGMKSFLTRRKKR